MIHKIKAEIEKFYSREFEKLEPVAVYTHLSEVRDLLESEDIKNLVDALNTKHGFTLEFKALAPFVEHNGVIITIK